MSSFRRTATNNAGDSTVYGANDYHVIVDLLNGEVNSIPPVKFKSTNAVKFWDNILKFRDSDDSHDISIRLPNVSDHRDLNIPALTSNDTIAVLAATQTLLNKVFNVTDNTLNVTSGAAGDLLKHNGTKFDRFPKGTANQYLRMDGSGNDLVWTGSTVSAHASTHGEGQSDALKIDDLAVPDDNTDLNASTSRHGLLIKLNGGSSLFLREDGTWASPPGAAGGEANTADNVGLGGVGPFKAKVGEELQFKNVNAGSSKITITDDISNDEIDIDVNENNLDINNIGGTLSVSKGGTGATTLTGLLVGNGTSAFTTIGAPSSDVVGITDTQTISSKTMSFTDNTFNAASIALGDILKSNGTKFIRHGIGTQGQVLTVGAGGDIEWAEPSGGGGGSTGGIINDLANSTGYLYGWQYPYGVIGGGILGNVASDIVDTLDGSSTITAFYDSATGRGVSRRFTAPDTDWVSSQVGNVSRPFVRERSPFVDFWMRVSAVTTIGCRIYLFFFDDNTPSHTSDAPADSNNAFGIMATGTGNFRMVTNNNSASQTLGGTDLFAKDTTLRHIRIELDEANAKGIITVDGVPSEFLYSAINEPTTGVGMYFYINMDETSGSGDQRLDIYRFYCGVKIPS